MAIEKKTQELETSTIKVTGDTADGIIKVRACFGWTFDQNSSNWNPNSKVKKLQFFKKRKLVFTRPTNIPYKEKLNELEYHYNDLESKKQYYVSIDPFNFLFLLILLIIPGVIYIAVKIHKKHKIKKNNIEIENEQQAILTEASRIAQKHGEPILSSDRIFAGTPSVRATPLSTETKKAPSLPSDYAQKGQPLSKSPDQK